MEGSPPIAPKKGMSKMLIVGIVVAIIAIVAIAGAIALMNNNGSPGSNNNGSSTSLNWTPKVGDYIEYTSTGLADMTMRKTIVSETATTYTINVTTTMMGMTNSQQTTVNKTAAFTGDYNPQSPPSGWASKHMGTDTLSTNWGSKVCDKWTATGSSDGQSGTVTMWIKGGVLMKEEVVTGSGTMTLTLTGTNVSALINE